MYVKEKGPVRTKNWSGKLSFGGITAPAFAKVLKKAGATTKRSSSYRSVVSKPLRLWFSGRADACPSAVYYCLQRNSFRHLSPNSAARRCAAEAAGTSLCQLDVYRVFVAVFRECRKRKNNESGRVQRSRLPRRKNFLHKCAFATARRTASKLSAG